MPILSCILGLTFSNKCFSYLVITFNGLELLFLQVKLSEYIGKKYVILFFYPLDFTFVCPTGESKTGPCDHIDYHIIELVIVGSAFYKSFHYLCCRDYCFQWPLWRISEVEHGSIGCIHRQCGKSYFLLLKAGWKFSYSLFTTYQISVLWDFTYACTYNIWCLFICPTGSS